MEVIAHYWIGKTLGFVAGFNHARRVREHPRRWIWIWSTLAFLVFVVALVVSVTVTWTAVEVALKNVSIGEIVPVKVMRLWESWWRVHPKPPTSRGE